MFFYKTKFHEFGFLKRALVLQILGWFLVLIWFSERTHGFVVLIWFYAKGFGNFAGFSVFFGFFQQHFGIFIFWY